MLYTPRTKLALKLCFDAHQNQVDKSGLPYVFHPFHLAEQMTDEDGTIVALLHDVIEDTSYTLNDIRDMGFGEPVVNALRLMTHGDGVPYLQYVARIRENPVARAVKLADLRHNSDTTRLNAVTEKDRKRLLKYRIAESILDEDRYDASGGYYRKRIPLDHSGVYFLSVFYTGQRVLRFSLDVERASDSHYGFDEDAATRIKQLFPGAPSLPEALAEYFMSHNDLDFTSLLLENHIPYKRFHGCG